MGTSLAAWIGFSVLAGSWTSNCFPLPRRHTLKNHLEFTDSRVDAEVALFAENDRCASRNWVIHFTAAYEIGSPSGAGHEFNYVPGGSFMTLLSQDVVDLYNREPQEKGCGLTDWKLGEARDVSGRVCEGNPLPVLGQKYFDLIGVSGAELRFSSFTASQGAASEAGRPSTLNANVAFARD